MLEKVQFKHYLEFLDQRMYEYIEPFNNRTSSVQILNEDLLKKLEIESSNLLKTEWQELFSGSSKMHPLVSYAYAGHQFGHFTKLGDGRAVSLGRFKDFEFQLKGTGITPFSRNGDGKATLKSMLKEYIISEALHFLNIPTSRSIGVLRTNQTVYRNHLEQGGILVRILPSYTRFGSVEYARAVGDSKLVKNLIEHEMSLFNKRYNSKGNQFQSFFQEVVEKQAILLAKWQSFGFVHGVLNTDNVLLNGYAFDFGPCAFINKFTHQATYSSIDYNKRYRFANQPAVTSFNLSKLATAMIELFDEDINKGIDFANKELKRFEVLFKENYYDLMAQKLGFTSPTSEEREMIDELLNLMEQYECDYTNTFYYLTINQFEKISFYQTKDWNSWFIKWTRALGYRKDDIRNRQDRMKQVNPVVIARNEFIERAINDAVDSNDDVYLSKLLEVIKDPFNYKKRINDEFLQSNNKKFVTYCGT